MSVDRRRRGATVTATTSAHACQFEEPPAVIEMRGRAVHAAARLSSEPADLLQRMCTPFACRPLSSDAATSSPPVATPPQPHGQQQEAPPSRADLSPVLHAHSRRRQLIDQLLRVDHAGETAAVRIYEGQAAVLGHTAEGPTLASMASHERAHLARFQQLVRSARLRGVCRHRQALLPHTLVLPRSPPWRLRSRFSPSCPRTGRVPARCCRSGPAPRTRWAPAPR